MDTVIDWMDKLLKPDEEDLRASSVIMAESNVEDEKGMTFEELEKQV
jgi:hypothetical protein